MKIARRMALACALLAIGQACAAQPAGIAPSTTLSHGRFDDMPVYRPAGGKVNGFALLLSGPQGWDATARRMAEALVAEGAMVAGIDTPRFLAKLNGDAGGCVAPDGDLENISRFTQAFEKLPTYFSPVVIGQQAGAALGYASSVLAPATRFAGLVTLDFAPQLGLTKPLCAGQGTLYPVPTAGAKPAALQLLPAARMSHPWIALQGATPQATAASLADTQRFLAQVPGTEVHTVSSPGPADTPGAPWVVQLRAAFAKLNAQTPPTVPAPPATISDLPVIEVPSSGKGDTLAILLSGDGGWAGLDRDVAASMSKAGVPVVGFDTLRYFWAKRTPASTAHDLDRLVRFYLTRWSKSRVILIGYSQGADVLPFAINRMPPGTLRHVPLAVMMGLGKKAAFEFKLTNWISAPSSGLEIRPEVDRLAAGLGMCIYGADEKDSSCPDLDPARVQVVKLPGGHHFDGDYDKLARIIMTAASKQKGTP